MHKTSCCYPILLYCGLGLSACYPVHKTLQPDAHFLVVDEQGQPLHQASVVLITTIHSGLSPAPQYLSVKEGKAQLKKNSVAV